MQLRRRGATPTPFVKYVTGRIHRSREEQHEGKAPERRQRYDGQIAPMQAARQMQAESQAKCRAGEQAQGLPISRGGDNEDAREISFAAS
jgi:hypothetical protein